MTPQGLGFHTLKAEDGGDHIYQRVPFRDLTENVHTVLDLGIFHRGQYLMALLGDLVHAAVVVRQIDKGQQLTLLNFIINQMLHQVCLGGIRNLCLLVLGQQVVQLFQIVIQTAGNHDGLHMIHRHRHGTTLGDSSFRGIVRIVDVQQRQITQAGIGAAGIALGNRLTRQKFQIAMGTHMDQHIGTEHPLKPAVSS